MPPRKPSRRARGAPPLGTVLLRAGSPRHHPSTGSAPETESENVLCVLHLSGLFLGFRSLWGRGLPGMSFTLPCLGLFSSPACSSSSGAAGAGMLSRAGWLSARSRAGPPAPCQLSKHKRHLRCVSQYLLQREVPHSHGWSPGSPGKGSQGSIGGSHTSNTLQKYLQESLFPTPTITQTGAVPLILTQFAKPGLTKPSSFHPRGLMRTVWMESQHSPRFRQRGGGVTMCAKASALPTSLLSPERGKASKSS